MLGIIVMLVVFLTSFASAWTSSTFSENKELTLEKESLTKYGTYNIQKHAWYDPLKIWTEETIKSIELKTNTEQCVDCLSEGTIVLNKDGTLIDDLIWKRSFDEGKTFVDWKGYTNWKLLVEEDVDVYETQCIDLESVYDEKNDTYYTPQECSQVKTGTEKQWNNLDFKKEYKAGTYNYKIEGSKKASVTYDWIIKTNGELLTNWAVWGAVIGVGGVEANITINSPANNSIVYSNPVTTNASANVTNGAYLVNATLYDNSTGSWEARNTSIIYSIETIYSDYFNDSNINTSLWTLDSTSNYLGGNGGITESGTILTIPDSNMGGIYTNNSINLSESYSFSANATTDGLSLYNYWGLGFMVPNTTKNAFTGTYSYFTGFKQSDDNTVDFQINRGGDSAIFLLVPNTYYVFNLTIYPLNNSLYATVSNSTNTYYYNKTSANVNPNLNYRWGMFMEKAGESSSRNAYIDYVQVTKRDSTTSFTQTYNNTYPSGSNIKWNYQFCDSDGDCGFSETNRTFSMDTSQPQFTDTTLNVSTIYNVGDPIRLNTTITDTNLDTCWYNYNNANTTFVCTSGVLNEEDITTIASQTNIRVWANDSLGNTNYSELLTFAYDTTPPTITLNYPTSLIDYGAVNGTLQLNFTATDTNLDYCGFGYYTITSNKIQGYGNIYQNHTNFSLIAQLHRVVSGGNPQLRYTITIPANCKNNGKITLYDDDTNVSCIDTGGANVTLTPSVGGHGLLTKFFEVTPCSSGVPIVKNITLSQNKVAEFYANDTAGNLNTTTFSWDYRVLFLNSSYDEERYETQSQNFVSHINYNTNASLQVLLNYDSTNYTTTNTGSGSYGIYSPTTFEAPFVSADTNKTFFWIFIYNSSTTYSSELNQTVKPIFLILCNGTYTNKTLNYTFIDEATGIPINANTNPVTFRSTFRYWFGSGLNYKNYSYQIINTTTTNNFSFCISPANYTFYTDIDLQYDAQDYGQRTLYERNESLTNVTQNISLYVLLSTSTQKFTIYLKQGIEPFTDVLTEVYKYFVGDGIYKLVTTGLSDDKGTFVANLDLDEQYKFIPSKDGYTYDEQIKQASCSVAPCEITLNIGDVVLSAYEDFYNYFAQNVEYNLTYNKSSSIVTLQFLDKIGTAEYWRLWVYQTNFANDTLITICDENTYSISGTMTCNYSSYDGDITAKVYISRSPEKLVDFINFVNENITEILGLTGILASIIIFLVIVFSGIRNPVNIFILIPFALVVLKFIGLLPLDWSWILALTIFDIWIITRLKT